MLKKSLSLLLAIVGIMSVSGAERTYDFVVAQDGTGDFTTVQEAINAVPDFRKTLCLQVNSDVSSRWCRFS